MGKVSKNYFSCILSQDIIRGCVLVNEEQIFLKNGLQEMRYTKK